MCPRVGVRAICLELARRVSWRLWMRNPFRHIKTSPDIIRLTVMMYVRFPLSLRRVEDLLHERGLDISYETVRAWWNRFGPMFAAEIRKRRSALVQGMPRWRWYLDQVVVRINGETHHLRRSVDHEGKVLEAFVTRTRDRKAALSSLRRALKRYGRPNVIVTLRNRGRVDFECPLMGQAAATASCHVCIASPRNLRRVLREMRWR